MADGRLSNECYILVTGANSGLGFGISCRLIDEFLHIRPQSHSLTLIPTTRDRRKSDDTVSRLRSHLHRALRNADKRTPGISKLLAPRVRFQPELLDLTSLPSVRAAAQRLLASTPKLDAVILNAGVGSWTGVDWPGAIYHILTDLAYAVTYPSFKIADVGVTTAPQLGFQRAEEGKNTAAEPPLGLVFCSNVFGHYLLAHYLMRLLSHPAANVGAGGRIVWVSSLEAHAHAFSTSDMQGLRAPLAYESSKRLTDVLALTADVASTGPWVSQFYGLRDRPRLENGDAAQGRSAPKQYLCHPGLVATGIFPVPWFLTYLMLCVLYVARWLGSPWHTIAPYLGATAPVWLALSPQEVLDDVEAKKRGKGKWGSATDWWGRERVMRTEVEGWGYGGVVGEVEELGREAKKGRVRGVPAVKEEGKMEFEALGRECWRAMEGLRGEWERRLERWEGKLQPDVVDEH